MRPFRILIVDDDSAIRKMITRVLKSEGMQTWEASDGRSAVDLAVAYPFDLIILDIVMEGIDGFEVLRALRSREIYTPVFVLSGRGQDTDMVFALGIGADDYITKPFSTSVLCAKVKACLRRGQLSAPDDASVLHAGPFTYLVDEMQLQKKGRPVPLSSKECFLMKLFLTNIGKVLSKEQIYRNVWRDTVVDDNTIMVHIRRLRTKIEDDPNAPRFVRTVRGVGYQFLIP